MIHPTLPAILLALVSVATSATAATIVSVAPAPGDSFTNPGSSNQGSPTGSTGWYYNNVRNGGVVGIDDSLPLDGNGSLHFSGAAGSYKADTEFYSSPLLFSGNYYATSSLGALSDLSSLSYSYYRSSATTNAANLAPALRLYVDADGDLSTTGDRGHLVFEPVYNGTTTVPTDSWIDVDVFAIAASVNVWGSQALTQANNAYQITLSEWQAGADNLNGPLGTGNALVLGISTGIGSGWAGAADYHVDRVAFGFGGSNTIYNFEVVPEPSWLALLSLPALAILRRRRAR